MFRPTRESWTRRKRELDRQIRSFGKVVALLTLGRILSALIFTGAALMLWTAPTVELVLVSVSSGLVFIFCTRLTHEKRRDSAAANRARAFVEDQLKMISDAAEGPDK